MRLIAAFAAGSAFLSPVACSEHARTAEPPPPLQVATGAVQTVTVADPLQAGGTVSARETAIVSSRVLAAVTRVHVSPGDRVRAGQVLVDLDARDLTAQAEGAVAARAAADQGLALARTELASVTSDHDLAVSWHGRIAALHVKHSVTNYELEEAEARLAGAAARLEGARRRIEQAEATARAARAGSEAADTVRSFATLRAPFEGVVTERLIDPGNLASPGLPLLRLDAAGALQVVVMVDESRAAFVKVGDAALVHVGDAHEAQQSGDSTVDGTVAEVARRIAAGQRAFSVKVHLPSSLRVPSGTFARVVFRGATREILVAPSDAITRTGQVASAFVVEEGVARLRLLHTGKTLAEGVQVLAGLAAGERVIRRPPPGLVDGRRVTTAAGRDDGDVR